MSAQVSPEAIFEMVLLGVCGEKEPLLRMWDSLDGLNDGEVFAIVFGWAALAGQAGAICLPDHAPDARLTIQVERRGAAVLDAQEEEAVHAAAAIIAAAHNKDVGGAAQLWRDLSDDVAAACGWQVFDLAVAMVRNLAEKNGETL